MTQQQVDAWRHRMRGFLMQQLAEWQQHYGITNQALLDVIELFVSMHDPFEQEQPAEQQPAVAAAREFMEHPERYVPESVEEVAKALEGIAHDVRYMSVLAEGAKHAVALKAVANKMDVDKLLGSIFKDGGGDELQTEDGGPAAP